MKKVITLIMITTILFIGCKSRFTHEIDKEVKIPSTGEIYTK